MRTRAAPLTRTRRSPYSVLRSPVALRAPPHEALRLLPRRQRPSRVDPPRGRLRCSLEVAPLVDSRLVEEAPRSRASSSATMTQGRSVTETVHVGRLARAPGGARELRSRPAAGSLRMGSMSSRRDDSKQPAGSARRYPRRRLRCSGAESARCALQVCVLAAGERGVGAALRAAAGALGASRLGVARRRACELRRCSLDGSAHRLALLRPVRRSRVISLRAPGASEQHGCADGVPAAAVRRADLGQISAEPPGCAPAAGGHPGRDTPQRRGVERSDGARRRAEPPRKISAGSSTN